MEAIYADEKTQALGTVVNHCPMGCALEDLDEYGYCQHLLGFTNDGKVVETVQPVMRKDPDTKEMVPTGDKHVSGSRKRGHLDKVMPGDKLVNPESPQLDKGVVHMKKEWVSSRVYRQVAPPIDTARVEAPRPTKPPVVCDECGLEFKNKSGLNLHKRHKHSEVMAGAS